MNATIILNEEPEIEGRMVTDIIYIVLSKIPTSETNLREDLRMYQHSLWNIPPEVLKSAEAWIPFIHILDSYIPIRATIWQQEIYDIKGDS